MSNPNQYPLRDDEPPFQDERDQFIDLEAKRFLEEQEAFDSNFYEDDDESTICDHCDGTGFSDWELSECSVCDGMGYKWWL